jgi:hypothetical protein
MVLFLFLSVFVCLVVFGLDTTAPTVTIDQANVSPTPGVTQQQQQNNEACTSRSTRTTATATATAAQDSRLDIE